MSVLIFTPADALQTVTVPVGTYTVQISKIDGPKASKSGKSVHYFVNLQIVQEGDYNGKEFTITVNTETKAPTLLGVMQYFPYGTFLEIQAAIQNKKPQIGHSQIETDDLMYKPFDAIIGVGTVDGSLINLINGFRPAGSGSSNGAPW